MNPSDDIQEAINKRKEAQKQEKERLLLNPTELKETIGELSVEGSTESYDLEVAANHLFRQSGCLLV